MRVWRGARCVACARCGRPCAPALTRPDTHPHPSSRTYLDDVGALDEPVLERPQAALAHAQRLLARQAARAARERHARRQEGQEVVKRASLAVGRLVVRVLGLQWLAPPGG
jgi:hypothetical protein